MSRYNREPEQPVFSFMDGVSVKISEQYKPPRKVGLPHGYQHRMSAETTNVEYDFTLEKSILQNVGEWRRLRKEAVERRKERVQVEDEIEKQAKLPSESPTNQIESAVSPSNAVSATNTATLTSPAVPSFTPHNTSILTPMQIAQPTRQVRASQISHFNLSDFEADTSSPFDNMELKTINEMEVLAHVLQPLSNSPDSKITGSCYSGVTAQSCDIVENRMKNEENAERRDVMGYAIYNSIHQDQNLYHYSSKNTSQQSYNSAGDVTISERHELPIENLNRISINNPNQSAYCPNRYTQSHSIPIKAFSEQSSYRQAEDFSPRVHSSYNFAPVCDVGDTEHKSFPPSNQGLDKTHSTSVPDMVQELEKELRIRSQSHNIATTRPNSYGSSGLENWSPWPTLESPQHAPTSAKHPTTGAAHLPPTSTLSNPYYDLPSNERRVAQHVGEMGFSQARAARACQVFGADERKVVEFLLQVQALESDGYPGDTVERALKANDYDQERTVEHLEAMKQLLDLGFNEEQVTEALVRFNNDSDKALDHLIS